MNTRVIEELVSLMTEAINDNKYEKTISSEKKYFITSCKVYLSYSELMNVCNELRWKDKFKALEPVVKMVFTTKVNRMRRLASSKHCYN